MKYDEEELNRAIEKGTKAWADVPDIGEWVAEQRGRKGIKRGKKMKIKYIITVEATGENESDVRKFAKSVLRNSKIDATRYGKTRIDIKSTGWRETKEDEHRCCNCIYEIYQGSIPECAMDMRHGKTCRFFKLVEK